MKLGYSLPERLCDAVTRPPFRVQIAFDANWMEAWRFAPDELPSSDAIQKTLAGREADVAVEFCFKLSDGRNFFFGQRRRGLEHDRGTLEFVSRALACAGADDWRDLPEFLSRLEDAMPLEDHIGKSALCRTLDNIEIGITDWWKRGDVVEVWNSSTNEIPTYDQLSAQLDGYPSLQTNDIKFVCLEFNFQSPLHHWFGIEISESNYGIHSLQAAHAHSWLVDGLSTFKVVG
ncbi:hypothetical protein QO002_006087 [Pararhizobium capsulatum DSM 1112]|uniref:Uncharacterized protein n=1 Tax=Pararhizobium capsulatum DSM 1112 TaxID=1121113 RepID=A0ABU0C031_9HYPH|nr:hypothetical protein [Pararhizobium capsulatum]MDQ0323880.1 hypothetical protein [Pararhizobium capsulatum DSM 1112]